ncbi:BirA family biotin operon repressor/biotin-[acetyl-CoA-carboxylase] ligase [Saccharothrix coeruleofusca]|nr:BirA family biotin operon repressor/biotin-[acetyl-CoA-carboxylase] ligase [Saccharothrix coeruleofusca]
MITPLDAGPLRARLVAPHGPYAALDVVASTGSTNVDLVAAARDGAPDRTVLIAEEQTAGQGRRGRGWVSPGGGLYLSVLLRPDVPPARLPWTTLLAGVALVRTARAFGVEAAVKWPNDLLVGEAKAAGVLAETVVGQGVVVGVGVNVGRLPAEVRPGPGGLPPTSFAEAGADADRAEVAATLLTELAALDAAWRAGGGEPGPLLDEYRAHCATLGKPVRVELAGSAPLLGTAVDVRADGTLVVRGEAGDEHAVSAGDVVHLRVR